MDPSTVEPQLAALDIKYADELSRARTGVSEFRAFIDVTSPVIHSYLVSPSKYNQDYYIPALFLGLKPACSIELPTTVYEDDVPSEEAVQQESLLIQSLALLPSTFGWLSNGKSIVIFNKDETKKVLLSNKDLFPDYDSSQEVDVYLGQLNQNKTLGLRIGALFGYPRRAVESFVAGKGNTTVNTFGYTYVVEDVTQEDRDLTEKVGFIFQASGMLDYINTLRKS